MVDRCVPPPEHQDKRWHWLDANGLAPVVLSWIDLPPEWFATGYQKPFSPRELEDLGYRYIGPCIPPARLHQ